jgi:hypothetical protein
MPDFTVREELLGMVGQTSRIIKSELCKMLQTFKIDSSKLAAVTTDGAPSMTGKNVGVIALMRQDQQFPTFLSYHCIIHQEALCAKDCNIQEVMRVVMDIVCFVRAHALNHRQLRNLLEELDSDQRDVLLYADIRWLSRAKVLLRFCELLSEIRMFMNFKVKNCDELTDPSWLLKLAFLTDILQHLNFLNKQLQGDGKTVVEMHQSIEAFQKRCHFLVLTFPLVTIHTFHSCTK